LFESVAERSQVPLDISPRLVEIFRDGQERYGPRAWSSMIVKRLEDACGVDLRAPGFPEEIFDDEPEAPGYEVVPGRGARE
jgi:3-hydroxyisobutyrate dehydrogenase